MARKVVKVLHDWGALRRPQLRSPSDSQGTDTGVPSISRIDEPSARVKDAAPVNATESRYLVDDAFAEVPGNGFEKALAAMPSGLAPLERFNENKVVASSAAEASTRGGQLAGVGKSLDGLIGEEVVGQGLATSAAGSVDKERSQGDEPNDAAGEFAAGTQGGVAVARTTAPSTFCLTVEGAFAEVSRAAHAALGCGEFEVLPTSTILL